MSHGNLKNLLGKRFGRLIVLHRGENQFGRVMWECRCDCGTTRQIRSAHLLAETIKSCGCWSRDATAQRSVRHGHACNGQQSPEYRAWTNALQRCTNPRDPNYCHYGARGIRVKFSSFEEFYQHIGPRPSPELSVDRIDVDGNYEPGNIHWATRSEQNGNKAFAIRNILRIWKSMSPRHQERFLRYIKAERKEP